MTATVHRQPGWCLGCKRDREAVESRTEHMERVLCDTCAAKPYRRPTASIADPAADNVTAESAKHAEAKGGRKLTLTPASEIKTGPVRWLWQGWVPLGALTVVAGEAGLGKSTLTGAHLTARITRGALPGELHGKPADVLLASAEDPWESVIVPRLMAENGNGERLHRIDVADDDGAGTFTLPEDVRRLEHALDALTEAGRNVAAILIDPVGAYLSAGTDSHKDASVRRALTPLAQLAMDRGLAVIAVAHLTKDASARLMSRVSGSVAFGAAPRSVIGVARDPEDPDGEQGYRRVVVHAKSNVGKYATSLMAHTEQRMVDTDAGLAETSRLIIDGESAIGVDDLQRGPDDDGPDAEEAIGQALAGGSRPSQKVKAEVAADIGCSRKTVQRAAMRMRERGELDVAEGGFPRTTTWALLGEDTPVGTHDHPLSVPTVGGPIDTGVSGTESASGDTVGVVVPIGNGHRPVCSCAAPADLLDDGRCSRCFGAVIA